MNLKIKSEPYYKTNTKALIFLILLIGPYIIENIGIFPYKFMKFFVITYYITIAIIISRLPKDRIAVKYTKLEEIYLIAAFFAIFYTIIYFMMGIVDGYGKSPFNHTFSGILQNLTTIIALIWFRECIRSKIIYNWKIKNNTVKILFVAVLFSILRFNIVQYSNIDNGRDLIMFSAQNLIPEVSTNILLSYLTLYGGVVASIIYIGILEIVHWVFPVLPNLKWISEALLEIMSPIFFLMIIEYLYPKLARRSIRVEGNQENPAWWIITSIVSIMIIWFSVGVFPIYPSVIASGSMNPIIETGDVILIKRIDVSEIKVGDIIQFDRNGIDVSHRVIETVIENNELLYRTQGDNNSQPDSRLVKQGEVRGKIIHIVPKVGKLTLLLKSEEDIDINNLDI